MHFYEQKNINLSPGFKDFTSPKVNQYFLDSSYHLECSNPSNSVVFLLLLLLLQ